MTQPLFSQREGHHEVTLIELFANAISKQTQSLCYLAETSLEGTIFISEQVFKMCFCPVHQTFPSRLHKISKENKLSWAFYLISL